MAVTYITRIYATIGSCIDYVIRDKVVLTGKEMQGVLKQEALEKANAYLENALDYIGQDKTMTDDERKAEIRKTLTSTIHCSYDRAKEEFNVIREAYAKDVAPETASRGRGKGQREILGYHVWQSFEEKVDPSLSNEIGKKLANELFGDYQCVISTHDNTDHTHNHIVFNAVSWKDGRKYNICTANTRKIREVSDRLCEEYGLSVLQATRDMNLKWYKDGSGAWKCFEATDRNREKRKGEFSKKTDYRNYEAYERSEEHKESNREVIRRDIDRFIPLSHSLEELIQNLQGIGYEVKNLNSNGECLKYMSFKAPSQDKFTRGNPKTLGEDYTREGIERRISNQGKERPAPHLDRPIEDEHKGTPNGSTYKYGEVDIEKIDEERKVRYSKQKDSWVSVPRNDVERYIIVDTKILNRNLETLYKKARAGATFEKNKYAGRNAKIQYHIDRINENLRALAFIEKKNLKTFEQINTTVQSLYEKRDEVDKEFSKIKELLKQMNGEIVLMKQYNSLKASIDKNKENREYVDYEMEGETALLRQYEDILRAKKLLTPEEQADRLKKFDSFSERFNGLARAYEGINGLITEYDRTVRVINRIDRDSDRRYGSDIKSYYEMRNSMRRNGSGRNAPGQDK